MENQPFCLPFCCTKKLTRLIGGPSPFRVSSKIGAEADGFRGTYVGQPLDNHPEAKEPEFDEPYLFKAMGTGPALLRLGMAWMALLRTSLSQSHFVLILP